MKPECVCSPSDLSGKNGCDSFEGHLDAGNLERVTRSRDDVVLVYEASTRKMLSQSPFRH